MPELWGPAAWYVNVKTLRCHWFDGKGGVSICGKQGLTGDMKITLKGVYCHYCYEHPRIPDAAFHAPEVRP
jgi:hypothetical protein